MKVTTKNLVSEFSLSIEDMRTIIKIVNGHYVDIDDLCARWLSQCFNRPACYELDMYAIDICLEGFGVEYLEHSSNRYLYSNPGSDYEPTIFYDIENRYFFISLLCDVITINEEI